MVHNQYLFQRNRNYYFRWRVPAELIPLVGQTEIRRSLRTLNRAEASVRAARLVLAAINIQQDKNALLTLELDRKAYEGRTQENIKIMREMGTRYFEFRMITVKAADGTETTVIDCKAGDGDPREAQVADPQTAIDPHGGAAKPPVEQELLFSELCDRFVSHKVKKEGLSEKMQQEYARYSSALIEIMGDKPLAAITRRSLKEGIQTYGDLPRRNLRRYKGLSVAELLELEVPEQDRVADKTVEQVRKMAQGIFSYAVQEEYMEESPARDLKLKLSSARTFAKWDETEVRSLLDACGSEKTDWKKWIPRLAAYTGARRGELAQLRKEDIKFDNSSQRYYVLITDQAGSVKTENGVRQVPLHNTLIETGFLQFVEGCGEFLFPGLNPEAITKWFSDKRRKLSIPAHDDYGNRKVFHSFRHTFITNSRGAGNPVDLVQQVVGHERISAGITDRYSHTVPLKNVLNVVDVISY